MHSQSMIQEVKPRVSEGDWKGPSGALKRVRRRRRRIRITLTLDAKRTHPSIHAYVPERTALPLIDLPVHNQAGSKSLFYLAPNSTVALPLVSGTALAMVSHFLCGHRRGGWIDRQDWRFFLLSLFAC